MKFTKNVLAFFILGIIVTFVIACNKNAGSIREITLSITKKDLIVFIEEKQQISYVTNDPLGVTFTSSDDNIATVDDLGNIKGLKSGLATIKISTNSNQDYYKEIKVTVLRPDPNQLIITGNKQLEVGENDDLTVIVSSQYIKPDVLWTSDNEDIAYVDENGRVTAVSVGKTKIHVRAKNNPNINGEFEISIVEKVSTVLTIADIDTPVQVGDEVKLYITIEPQEIENAIIWSSSNDSIATINQAGVLKAVSAGAVTISAKLANDDKAYTSKTITIYQEIVSNNILDLLMVNQNANVNFYKFTAYGYTHNYQYSTYQSVSNYYFGKLQITQKFIPQSNNNRPGKMEPLPTNLQFNKDNILWVVVHDTGDTGATATAKALANYVSTPTTESSWHYSVDDKDIYQHLPDNEIAYHAGDGLRLPSLTDTGVKATTFKPVIKIDSNGYYVLNGIKSVVLAPGKNNITPNGIYTKIGTNGNYYIMNSYYNSTFGTIANTGGNTNGIGIEMVISQGSDIYRTWQKTAKLVASLLIKYNLPLENFKYHQDFSGKLCPQSLIKSGLTTTFENMVAIEYEIAKKFGDAQITFKSLDPDYLDNTGRIIKFPSQPMMVSYEISVNKDGISSTKELSSFLSPTNN